MQTNKRPNSHFMLIHTPIPTMSSSMLRKIMITPNSTLHFLRYYADSFIFAKKHSLFPSFKQHSIFIILFILQYYISIDTHYLNPTNLNIIMNAPPKPPNALTPQINIMSYLNDPEVISRVTTILIQNVNS